MAATGLTLANIADDLEQIAEALQERNLLVTAAMLQRFVATLKQRHDHADPCNDIACPCRKAEADHWREAETPPPAPYKHKKQPTWPGLHVYGGP